MIPGGLEPPTSVLQTYALPAATASDTQKNRDLLKLLIIIIVILFIYMFLRNIPKFDYLIPTKIN